MTQSSHQPSSLSYAYEAQTFEGQPFTGTIDAADLDDANRRLSGLRLRVMRIDPVQRPARAKPLGGDDFAMFNQQLAHLSAASLPVEQGLRLIAEDLRHGGLAQSIRLVADELNRGIELGEAFRRHEKQFPPLYATLIEVGVRSGNLSGVLLNLGRHLQLVSRLRESIWRSAAYPLAIFGGMLAIMIFLGHYVLPQFEKMYGNWFMELPGITILLLKFARWTPWLMALALLLFVGAPLLWGMLRAARLDRAAADLALHLPMIGPILRRNLLARWCDALQLVVRGGTDLPTAIGIAADVVGSPLLRRDSRKLIAQLEAGREVNELHARLHVVPPSALAIMQLSSQRSDLPDALQTLSRMYEQQAEMRLSALQTVLMPALVVLVALLVTLVVLGMFAPMISLIQSLT